MAIKMKHSGNATATTFASMGGGQGKRRAEDARAFAQIAASQNAAANRQLQGAHASPVSAAAPHAQLISAPTGGGAHAIPGPGGVGVTTHPGGGSSNRGQDRQINEPSRLSRGHVILPAKPAQTVRRNPIYQYNTDNPFYYGENNILGKSIGDVTGTVGARVDMKVAGLHRSRRQEFLGPEYSFALPAGTRRSGSAVSATEDVNVTGTDRFNQPDKDSQWDPGNGGRWIRKWLPGEKEAEAFDRTLSVKTPYEKELLDFKNLLAMENDAFSKQLGIASMPTKNQMGDLSPLGSQLQKAYEVVLSTLGTKTRGDSIGLQRIYDGIIGGGATSEAPVEQQGAESTPDIASIYANGGSYFGNGGTNDVTDVVQQQSDAVQNDPASNGDDTERQYNWF